MTPQPNPKRVLVVDDDAMSRELLSLLLEQEGYAVQSADSGESALALLSQQLPPDLVLTDMQMPGTTGADLALELRRACGPSTVLLAISGSQPPAETISLFNGFLMKPFQIAEVTAALLRHGADLAEGTNANSANREEKTLKKKKLPDSSNLTLRRLVKPAASSPKTASNISMNAERETHHAPPSTIVSTENSTIGPVLNENIYRQLAVTVPADQLHEMYAMCVNDARRRIAGMRTLAQAQDSARFVREAHAIKGGCGMLGATELHRMAAELEANGLKAGASGAEQEVNSLDELSAACDRLERMLGSRV
jgi:CheY-like chemotaxis protein/HPt (histidine-containing phosphotransfer) domain-containing protein